MAIFTPILFLFSLALQIQLTLLSGDGYQGIRVSGADLLLPFTGVFILASLLFKHARLPLFYPPFGYWAPLLLSAIFALALVNGYVLQGEWSQWALLNKGAGWVVLMAYLAVGGWFASNARSIIRPYFILPFSLFLISATVTEAVLRIFSHHPPGHRFTDVGYNFGFDLSGFMVNRNAFAFLYLCALILGSIFLLYARDLKRIETFAFKAMWAITPVMLAYNLSRSLMLTLAVFLGVLIVKFPRFTVKNILPFLLIGSLLVPLTNQKRISRVMDTFHKLEQSIVIDQNDEGTALAEIDSDALYHGDYIRLELIKHSWALIKEHPITGAGLGALLHAQQDKPSRQQAVMDNTALWLLTETGPFGLLAFLGVYGAMLLALWRKSSGMIDEHAILARAVFFMLIAFGAFSMLHEILYSRFLWFFLGLALCGVSLQTQGSNHQKTS